MDTATQTRQVTVYQAAPPAAMTLSDTIKIAEIFAASGFFQDAKQMAQAVTKILAGAELGFGPMASMQGIHVIQGRTSLSANLLAAAIKRSGKYNYRVLEMTADAVEIAFFEWGEEVGRSRFTKQDASAASTKNMTAYPRNMLFARAISNGARWYCADIFAGGVYTPEELGAATDSEGDYVAGEVVAPQPVKASPDRPDVLLKALADWHEEAARALANGIQPAERDIDTTTHDELRESSTRLYKLRLAAEEVGWPEMVLKAATWEVPYQPLEETVTRKVFKAEVEELAAALAEYERTASKPADDDEPIDVPF